MWSSKLVEDFDPAYDIFLKLAEDDENEGADNGDRRYDRDYLKRDQHGDARTPYCDLDYSMFLDKLEPYKASFLVEINLGNNLKRRIVYEEDNIMCSKQVSEEECIEKTQLLRERKRKRDSERDREKVRMWEREREWETEKVRMGEKDKEKEKEKEKKLKKKIEKKMEKKQKKKEKEQEEKKKKEEKEKVRQMEVEKEKVRQMEVEKEKVREMEVEKDKVRKMEVEKEKKEEKEEKEKEKAKEKEKEKLREMELEVEWLRRKMERERLREMERASKGVVEKQSTESEKDMTDGGTEKAYIFRERVKTKQRGFRMNDLQRKETERVIVSKKEAVVRNHMETEKRETSNPLKRKRGRPRIHPITPRRKITARKQNPVVRVAENAMKKEMPERERAKRGRPRKADYDGGLGVSPNPKQPCVFVKLETDLEAEIANTERTGNLKGVSNVGNIHTARPVPNISRATNIETQSCFIDVGKERNTQPFDASLRTFYNDLETEAGNDLEEPRQVDDEEDKGTPSDCEILSMNNSPIFHEDNTPFVISKIFLTMEDGVSSGMQKQSEFREKLMAVLREPYNEDEYDDLYDQVKEQRPIVRDRELRNGTTKAYISDSLARSYFNLYEDLKEKIMLEDTNKPRTLNILRGFFFWLTYLTLKDSFKPWLDEDCLKVMPPLTLPPNHLDPGTANLTFVG